MATPDIIRFVNPTSHSVTLDLSSIVRRAEFPPPVLRRTESESFLFPGAFIGSSHHGLRKIVLELVQEAANHDALLAAFQSLVQKVEALDSLEFRFANASASNSVFFDIVPSQVWFDYDWHYTRANKLPAFVEIDAQPYPSGPSITPDLTIP